MLTRTFLRFCSAKPSTPSPPAPPSPSQILQNISQFQQSQQKMQSQLELRIKQLQKKHRETQQLIDNKIKFPIKLCGTSDTHEPRYSYMIDRVMSYYRIPTKRITQYLVKMFKASLYAIADRNTAYMDQYWESGLKARVLQSIDEARKMGLDIKVQQDPNYMDEVQQSCQILDSVMIRGLSLDRQENKPPKSYHKYVEAEQVGMITYTPLQLTTQNQNFSNPAKNKTVYDGYDKMLLRTLVRIKSPLRLVIPHPDYTVSKQIYTWQHICVMENQMGSAKHLESSYKIETLMEWIGKYRFGPWKVVDLDNFMHGNSPFRKHLANDGIMEIDPVFKGTKLDKSHYVDIRMI